MDSHTDCRAVPDLLRCGVVAVDFDEHGVVYVCPKRSLNSFQVSLVSVRRNLDSVLQTTGKVGHEGLGGRKGPLGYKPARNKFGVRAERHPRPDVAIAKFASLVLRNVLLFGVAKCQISSH